MCSVIRLLQLEDVMYNLVTIVDTVVLYNWNLLRVKLICMLSHFWLFVTLWTVALQALVFIGISRQEFYSGLPCPPPGNLSSLGIELLSCDSCIADKFFTTEPLRQYIYVCVCVCVCMYMYTYIYTQWEKDKNKHIYNSTARETRTFMSMWKRWIFL